MSPLNKKTKGIGVLLLKVDAKAKFEVVCAECHQPLTIVSILHFADCPQVSVAPCLCQAQTVVDLILGEMKDDIGRLDIDKQQSKVPSFHPKDFPPSPQERLP